MQRRVGLLLRGGGADLIAFDKVEQVGVDARLVVDEPGELREFLRVLEHLAPLVGVGVDVPRHHGVQVVADTENVVEDHLTQVLDAAVELLQPGCGALQPLGRRDVEHEEPVDGGDEFGLGEILGE